MSRIQVAGYSEALRRRLNLDGDQGPRELGPEIHPIFDVEPGPPDWQYLAAVRRMSGFANQAAVAAEFQEIIFSNPVGSGVIAVLEEMGMSCTTTCVFQVGYGSSAATGQGPSLDTRWFVPATGPVGRAACRISARTNAASSLLTGNYVTDLLANTPWAIRPGWVLTPGFNIVVAPTVQNLAIRAWFQWRERAMQTFEAGSG